MGLALAAAACHRAAPSNGAWRLQFTATPAAPAADAPVQLQLEVTTAAGAPLAGARAWADLEMRDMDMGPSRVMLNAAGPGRYQGTGNFLMPGGWQCRVTVSAGARTQVALFPVTVH
ncbi:MAG: FixH family protein [Terriglobales bacterium]